MQQAEVKLRLELTKYARKIVDMGLVVGPGGNISARHEDIMYISPSGFAFEDIEPDQWVPVSISTGDILDNTHRPSSEVLMHLYGYRVNEAVTAMVHTHPAHCIAFTLVEQHLPMMFPDQAALVGEIGFVDYVVPTTHVLADAVAAKITAHNSLLLGNHGLVTVGKNLREAFYRTQVVEESAKIYLLAKSVGTPKLLTVDEYKEIQGLESEAYRVNLLQQL
ncbi:class II aldolase/adducin family protein [Paenibacillus sp. GCM10023252]|uniref:class II aldolase/adducin family protein n=1 Tax=Paenibacillus sp. GCM10023252 TaxID=3252649 RepID=UPI003616A156